MTTTKPTRQQIIERADSKLASLGISPPDASVNEHSRDYLQRRYDDARIDRLLPGG